MTLEMITGLVVAVVAAIAAAFGLGKVRISGEILLG